MRKLSRNCLLRLCFYLGGCFFGVGRLPFIVGRGLPLLDHLHGPEPEFPKAAAETAGETAGETWSAGGSARGTAAEIVASLLLEATAVSAAVPQHSEFPRQFPQQPPQQFWEIRAPGPWGNGKERCLLESQAGTETRRAI